MSVKYAHPLHSPNEFYPVFDGYFAHGSILDDRRECEVLIILDQECEHEYITLFTFPPLSLTLRESTHILLYEAMLTLVLLLSPSLHRPSPRSPAGSHPLLDCMHQQVHLASDVVQKLFKVQIFKL